MNNCYFCHYEQDVPATMEAANDPHPDTSVTASCTSCGSVCYSIILESGTEVKEWVRHSAFTGKRGVAVSEYRLRAYKAIA